MISIEADRAAMEMKKEGIGEWYWYAYTVSEPAHASGSR
jgi:hypothetical protein